MNQPHERKFREPQSIFKKVRFILKILKEIYEEARENINSKQVLKYKQKILNPK